MPRPHDPEAPSPAAPAPAAVRTLARRCAGTALLVALPCHALDMTPVLDRLEALRQAHGVAGFALAVVTPEGPVHIGGGGLAEREGERPVGPDTIWRVGSVTKMFTALATVAAARREGFDLETPVRKLVPDAPFENPWAASSPVTVGQLLEHTAGFSDLTKREFDSNDPGPLSLEEAFAVDPSSRVVHWPPGRYASYTNAGAGLAALVIERTTGTRYEDFVRREILAPLGMQDSGFVLDAAARPRLAAGYDRDGVTRIPYWHTLYRAFGGLDTTTADMARFLSWLLVPRPLGQFRPADIERLEHPRTTLAARDGLEYGYGLGLYHYVHDGLVWNGHGGDADGYLARLGYQRDAGVAYFLVINAFNSEALREMREVVESALTRGVPRPPAPPVAEVPGDVLADLAGCYVSVTKRFPEAAQPEDPPLRVEVESGHLVATAPSGRRTSWYPVSERHFRQADEPVATSAFVRDEDGEWVFQGDAGNLRRAGPSSASPCGR